MMSPVVLTISLVHCSSISDTLLVNFGLWPIIGKRPVRVTLTKSHEHEPDFQRHNCPPESELAHARRDGGRAATGSSHTTAADINRKGPARR